MGEWTFGNSKKVKRYIKVVCVISTANEFCPKSNKTVRERGIFFKSPSFKMIARRTKLTVNPANKNPGVGGNRLKISNNVDVVSCGNVTISVAASVVNASEDNSFDSS